MNRRGFLGTLGLGALPASTLGDGYEPLGYTTPNDPWALDIDKVLVDGVEVKHVFEFDDVEGYVRFYDYAGTEAILRPRVAFGKVRVIFKEERK